MNKSTPIQDLQTQMNISADPDETIQEVLQHLGAQPVSSSSNNQELQNHLMQQQFQQQQHQMNMSMQQMNNYPTQAYYNPLNQVNVIDRFNITSFWDKDAKMTLYIGVLAAVVMLLPIEKIVFKYLNIDHIPNSSIIIKSAILAISYYVLAKLHS